MSEKNYYTASSLEKLKQELDFLQREERPSLSKQIKEAMDKGDLKENAEYHAAKEAQGFLEMKIAHLKNEIAHARIIDENSIDTSSVSILNKVKIKNQQTGKIFTYKLVSAKDTDLKQGKISIASPIGQGLLAKKVGEIAHINVPVGKLTFEILDISI